MAGPLFQPSTFDTTWCRLCDSQLPKGFPVHFFGGGEKRCEACLSKEQIAYQSAGGRVEGPVNVPVYKNLEVAFPKAFCGACKAPLPLGSRFFWRSNTIGVCCMPPPVWAVNAPWFISAFQEMLSTGSGAVPAGVASVAPGGAQVDAPAVVSLRMHRLCEHCGAVPLVGRRCGGCGN